MPVKKTGKWFFCPHSKGPEAHMEFIPFKKGTEELIMEEPIICPVCKCGKKPHRYKMFEVKKQ